jgi:hypothetical protein
MASPLKEKSLLSDELGRGLITSRQANVADPAAITQLTPPAGGTGATAGAYDTSANRDLMIASITAGAADLLAVRAKVVLILDCLEAHGLMVAS